MSRTVLLAGAALAAVSAPLLAEEEINYSYDARGRLIAVARSGTVNNGANVSYAYDKGDNRVQVTATGGTPAPAPPSFAVANAAAVTEGGTLSFTVTKTGTTASSFTVNFASGDGTAAGGSDYTASSGTLTFAAGETSKTVTVATIDDSEVEADETVLVTLSAPSGGATVTTAQASGTIANNDAPPAPAPSFAVANAAAVTEGAPLVFTITKTGSTASAFSVNYATANGSASAGSDYQATSGTLSFAPSEASKTISVPTIDDGAPEQAETVLFNLSSPSGGATVSAPQASGTINSNVGANTPPTTLSDVLRMNTCQTAIVNVTANDSDFDGDLPLTLISVTPPASASGALTAQVISASDIQVTTKNITGLFRLEYTIKDSRNAIATGSATVSIRLGSTCAP